MIADWQTNKIYFSDLLEREFPQCFSNIMGSLKEFNIEPKFLKGTKDIWARDYMPIQINDNEFVEYRFDPDYLQGSYYRNLKTYPDIICDSINLTTKKSDLVLDGGNVVKSSNCVILTDKIVKENRHFYTKKDLIEKIHNTFQVDKVILIPQDKKDVYGHADGMLRFIDNSTVIINHFYIQDSVIQYRLKQAGIKCEPLNYRKKSNDKLNWSYINFLQTKDLIILPKFGIEEDGQAFEQIENFYPDYKGRIAQVEMEKIVAKDGALNCITWTKKE